MVAAVVVVTPDGTDRLQQFHHHEVSLVSGEVRHVVGEVVHQLVG